MLPENITAESSQFTQKLDSLGLSIATLTGMPVSDLLGYRPDKKTVSAQPASKNIGACTKMVLEAQAQYETFGTGTPYSLIDIIESMKTDLQKRQLTSDQADLLAYLVKFVELTSNHPEQERIINELDDRLFVLATEVKDALEIDFDLVGIHKKYNQVIFNPRLNGKTQRALIMAALKLVLNPSQEKTDQEWLEDVIIPIKGKISESEGKKIRLKPPWQKIAGGGQTHFSKKMEARLKRQKRHKGPFHTWDYWVGPRPG